MKILVKQLKDNGIVFLVLIIILLATGCPTTTDYVGEDYQQGHIRCFIKDNDSDPPCVEYQIPPYQTNQCMKRSLAGKLCVQDDIIKYTAGHERYFCGDGSISEDDNSCGAE